MAIDGTPSCTDVKVTLSVNDFRYASTTDPTTRHTVPRIFNFPNANGFGNTQSCLFDQSPTTIIDLRGTPFAVKGGASAFRSKRSLSADVSAKCHSSNQYCEYKLTGYCGHALWTPVLSVIDACLFCNSLGKFLFVEIHSQQLPSLHVLAAHTDNSTLYSLVSPLIHPSHPSMPAS